MVADIAPAPESEGVAFCQTDLRDDAQIAALVTATKAKFGRIDFLVNVACSYLDNGADSTRSQWLEALDINIVGSVMLMQAARHHRHRRLLCHRRPAKPAGLPEPRHRHLCRCAGNRAVQRLSLIHI